MIPGTTDLRQLGRRDGRPPFISAPLLDGVKRKLSAGARAVGAYLARVPVDQRPALQDLRRTILSVVPSAEEGISYGMPAVRKNGVLVYYAAFQDHCSFFPGSVRLLRTLAAEVQPFATGKGTLQFTPQHPLPTSLVKRIVRERVRENDTKAAPHAGPKKRVR